MTTNFAKMLCVLVLVISSLTSASPINPGTSTARYSLGGHTHITQLPQFSNTSHAFYTEMLVKILTEPTLRAENVRKIKRKDQQILANFVKNNIEDLNTPNKTFKLTTVKVSTVNKIRVGSSTSKPVKTSTRKSTKVVPSRIIVNAANAVTVSTVKTTKAPFKIKLAPRPYVKVSPGTTVKYRNVTKRPKTKPTIRRVVTKWSDRPSLNEIKQNWYEDGVPYPTPNPEIISNSPPFSINEVASQVAEAPQSAPTDLNNAISTFNLEMAPDATNIRDGAGSGCPTVHISSSVLTPQQRQDCSDLNLVINSHFHQNSATERTPLQPETYDANAASPEQAAEDAPGQGGQAQQAPPPGVAADPGGGASQAVAPSPGAGGTGGSGGSGGSGGDGNDGSGGLHLPNFKHLFDFIRFLCDKLGPLFSFLRNPWFYLVPMILFFIVGFAAVLVFFPWWIPALFLYLTAKESTKKSNVSFYKHVHKPVHHADGWFWNQQTKTWQNVAEYHHQHHQHYHPHRRVDDDGLKRIEDAIKKLSRKYGESSTQSWKWRRRNR